MERLQSALLWAFGEVRRRRVLGVATLYVLVAWLLLKTLGIVLPDPGLPEWASGGALTWLAIAGFPLAVGLAWLSGTHARVVTSPPTKPERRPVLPPRFIDFLIIAVLAAIAAYLWVTRSGVQPAATATPSVAVLPFTDLSDGQDNEYFADGISGEILSQLARLPELHVAARTSSFAFKDTGTDVRTIGRKLEVGAILEGSVRRAGDRLRITTQLVNVKDGFQLWSGSYDRTMDDVFLIQDEISHAVVDALKVRLLEEPRRDLDWYSTASFDAYSLYLRGRHELHQRTPGSLHTALDLFERAIDLDQNFAPAYSGLADSYALLISYGNLTLEQAQSKAVPALRRALQIDNQLAEAHASLGLLRAMQGDDQGAEESYRRAIELNPNYPMAHMWLGVLFMEQDRVREAYQAYEAARALDPLHPVINSNIASVVFQMGRYEEGSTRLQQVIEMEPEADGTLRALAFWSGVYGKLDEAVAWARRAVAVDPDAPLNRLALAEAYLWLGDAASAERWLLRAREVGPDNLSVFSGLAEFYMLTENFQALEQHTQAALEALPTDGSLAESYVLRTPLVWAGMAKLMVNDNARAVQLFERALGPEIGGDSQKGFGLGTLTHLALAYQKNGEPAEAEAVIARCMEMARKAHSNGWDNPLMKINLARLHAIQDNKSEALDLLQQAYAQGWRRGASVQRDIAFDSVRWEPAFEALMSRVATDVAASRERVRYNEANF